MEEKNSDIRNNHEVNEGSREDTLSETQVVLKEVSQIKEDVSYLRDLFVRRLNDDKQKNSVIQKLADGATYAFIEPFLYDMILLLDRLEKSEDDFVLSVREELYEILNRRGVERIVVAREFDPTLHKAVKVSENSEVDSLFVEKVIRNGYTFSGKVIRAAEVALVKPKTDENNNKPVI